jgi:2-methylcitrate dehydratase PrpD
MTPSLSQSFAEFCIDLESNRLAPEAVERLSSAVLDGIASMLAGVAEPVSAQALAAVGDASNTGECVVVGFGRRLRPRDAAFVNGTIAHASEYDDSSWTMWGHPTAPMLPALLAVAESRRASGMALLTAFAAGMEVEKALGLLMQPEHYRRGWHPTVTVGLFGAVAGTARLLGLTVSELQAAFGIAASMAAGLRSNAGYGAKPLHAGLAARNGLEAVLLARAGVSSNPHALEGDGGLLALYGASHADKIKEAVDRLGRPFEVVDPGLSPKLYPCCSDIHCAIDAVLDERAKHAFAASDVVAVRCSVAPMAEPNVRRRNPGVPVEAKFSMSHCVACAIVFGRVGLAQFTPTALADEAVRAVAARVTTRVDASLAEGGGTFSSPVIVEIDLRGGRRLRTFLREMRGHPDRPLSSEEMQTKFFECAGGVLAAPASRALYSALTSLETAPNLLELMRLASGGAQPAEVEVK